ncbi:sigma-54 dependent transcriptional regulator [Akkermansia sp. N21169]|jgi:two-component system response regulator AtoC|uniref:sigma-54-dependent transcriptional regulator n=1 Tax=unclassified Akkermansia TaxID=2608915 RepID=UPI00244E6344|nr:MULTISPECIES: sigma-54 dependent transcriptional regulator [unclassified Akkermansia]MDH3069245.1 sigma-54 dependent transcriptional regulator [Akkermansia sp. N21169]WPX41476.1 sigma-54 dependent transcriptional regulator [Akkermansia sp. N21116]
MSQPILLIVDDEKPTRDALRMALEDIYDVYTASNLTQAANILDAEPVDLILTDLRLGGENGMDLLDSASAREHPPVCIVMTAYGSVDTAVEAMKRGAYHFVTKPLNLDEVELLLKRAQRTRSLESANRELEATLHPHKGLDRLLGKSEAMEKVFRIIRQVAPGKTTVLIEGESGTGKELVAHAIHALSPRASKPFVVVNCAALSPQLLESELFGHEKGAFTGAVQKRIGRFEEANGGSIFLDEIGEIDPATQVRLLRVLSERTIERVGSNTPVPIDVRVIAATNKSLKKLVEEGTFREDLFFRLNVVKIDMPPLRERQEDIILLSNAFLKEFAGENGKTVKPLSDQATRALLSYPWPGNVRELRTAIEHGVVMSNGSTVDLTHLPAQLRTTQQEQPESPPPDQPSQPITHIQLVHPGSLNLLSLEKEAIRQALRITGDNRTAAAKLLGISRRTLQRKIAEDFDPTKTSESDTRGIQANQ